MQKIDVSTKKYPNMFAVVDDDIYSRLNVHKWSVSRKSNRFYARRSVGLKTIWMHRIIMNALPAEEIDHKDLNGLNNLRSNLRVATRSQNIANQIRHSSTSKYKGVRRETGYDRWQARIKHNYKEIYLGLYKTEIEAAHAYDRAAKTCFKEFARTNF